MRLWQQLRDEVEALEKGQVVEVTAESQLKLAFRACSITIVRWFCIETQWIVNLNVSLQVPQHFESLQKYNASS